MTEIVFLVEDDPEAGYTARALGKSIFTQADDLKILRQMVRDAVHCHFPDERSRPKISITKPIAPDRVDSSVEVAYKVLDASLAIGAAFQRTSQSLRQKILPDSLRHSYPLQSSRLVQHHGRVVDILLSSPAPKWDSLSFAAKSEHPQLYHPPDPTDGRIHEEQHYAHPASCKCLVSPVPKTVPLDLLSTIPPVLPRALPRQYNSP